MTLPASVTESVSAACQQQRLSRAGDRYVINDVNGTSFDRWGNGWFCFNCWGHGLSHCNSLGTKSSVSVMDTRFPVCAALWSDIEKWRRYVSHNLRRGFVRIQPFRPRYIHGDWRRFPNHCRVTVRQIHGNWRTPTEMFSTKNEWHHRNEL